MGALKSKKCSKGHPMAAPNLYMRPDGQRECRKCKNLRARELRKRRKQSAPKVRVRKSLTVKQKIEKGKLTQPDQIEPLTPFVVLNEDLR